MADVNSCRSALVITLCLVIAVWIITFLRAQEARRPSVVAQQQSEARRLDYFPDKRAGWFRETVQWDAEHNRFLVSHLEGGIGQIPNAPAPRSALALEQVLVPPLSGLSTLGFKIDPIRNRVVAAVAGLRKHNFSAVVAYDIRTWEQIFHVKLAGPERASLAEDVAVDAEGNIYVTDAVGALIWKVTSDGSSFEVLTAKGAFDTAEPKSRLAGSGSLSGIVYHPEGFLLVVHTAGECMFKVSLDGQGVRRVDLHQGTLRGDHAGIVLVSPSKLAFAGLWTGVRLAESRNAWLSANITHFYAASPAELRLATSVTVKDGDVFVNYLVGEGIPYHSTVERAVFTPVA